MSRTKAKQSGVYHEICMACGEGKPTRSLCVCRVCWQQLPKDLALQAYKDAKYDREKILIGETMERILVYLQTS